MNDYTDQRGRRVTRDAYLTQLAESILANVIALTDAGVADDEVRVIAGADGGTVIGGEAMFQTPVVRRLSDEDARALFQAVGALMEQHRAGTVPTDRLARIRRNNNVARKIEALRQSSGEER